MALHRDGTFRPGMVIVVFQKDVTEVQAQALITSLNLKSGVWMNSLKQLVVEVPVGSEQDWIRKLCEMPRIRTASVNGNIKP